MGPLGWPGKPKTPPAASTRARREAFVTDVSLTQAARHSVTGDPYAIVGHIQNAFFVGDLSLTEAVVAPECRNDVDSSSRNHTENDGVGIPLRIAITIGGDLDT